VLATRGLHEFEVCALGNLAPSNAEEAKALAPSLDLPIHAHLSAEVRVHVAPASPVCAECALRTHTR
jgi:hypothetical protein